MNKIENEKDKVCAVVVTYNRKKLLLECLEALRKQTRPLQGIYLIDNASTDGTPELLLKEGYISELPPKELKKPWEKKFEVKNLTDGRTIDFYYVRMHENTGGAGGFYEGLKRAYERGFDWFWLMDDDGFPASDCLEKLLKYKYVSKVIAPLVLDKNSKNLLAFTLSINGKLIHEISFLLKNSINIIEGDANFFNGVLFKADILPKIDLPRKDFFAWGDEVEYLLRIKRSGIKIITVVEAKFYHPRNIGKLIKPVVRGKLGYILSGNDYFRIYIKERNHFYIQKEYFGLSSAIFLAIKNTIKRIIIGDFHNLYWAWKGYLDGWRKKFGKEVKYFNRKVK
jgi:GT2 family glycosyltransferase